MSYSGHKILISVEFREGHNKHSNPQFFEKTNFLTRIHYLLAESTCHCTKLVTINLSQNKLVINIFETFLPLFREATAHCLVHNAAVFSHLGELSPIHHHLPWAQRWVGPLVVSILDVFSIKV